MEIAQNVAERKDAVDIRDTSRYSLPVACSNFVAMIILVRMPKTLTLNQIVTVKIDKHSKLRRSVTVSGTTASHAALTFVKNWTISSGIPSIILTYNDSSLSANFSTFYAASSEMNN